MLPRPPLCFLKQGCQANLGGALQSGRRTLWCEENCGRTIEVFLLAKFPSGCWKIQQILHCLCHCQANY